MKNSTTSTTSPEEKLGPIRREIDQIDQQLLELLNKRASLSLQVGAIKADKEERVYKPARERQLLDSLAASNSGPLPELHLRSIWREILSSSRALQRPQQVAYLGPEGTFSYFAALEFMGHSAVLQPCKDIAQIFEKVSSGQCDLGIVPLENSLQGTVGISVDLFLKYNVRIDAELYSHISHALLSQEKDLAKIKKVFSHPQPLAQCGNWLRANLPNAELIPEASTAASAKRATQEEFSAALGNANLSTLYRLPILANQVEDNKNNWTRFVIISRPEPNSSSELREEDNKTSALFTIPDKPGTLAKVLDLLGRNGLNMRKIESRPMASQPWHYVFFVDIENNLNDPRFSDALSEISQNCHSFRILGTYPQGQRIDHPVDVYRDEKGE